MRIIKRRVRCDAVLPVEKPAVERLRSGLRFYMSESPFVLRPLSRLTQSVAERAVAPKPSFSLSLQPERFRLRLRLSAANLACRSLLWRRTIRGLLPCRRRSGVVAFHGRLAVPGKSPRHAAFPLLPGQPKNVRSHAFRLLTADSEFLIRYKITACHSGKIRIFDSSGQKRFATKGCKLAGGVDRQAFIAYKKFHAKYTNKIRE